VLEGTAPIRLAEASEGLDLLCLGSRGYGPVRRVLLGSVSSDVVNHAASAVMVVPRTDRDED
jgi:nucleotide-binding universal stress UspA family protein